jgi:hypothetical protein
LRGLPRHILEKTTVFRKKGVEIWAFDGNLWLQVNDKTAQKFVVICPVAKQSKRIYDLASGNHEMYMRRKG